MRRLTSCRVSSPVLAMLIALAACSNSGEPAPADSLPAPVPLVAVSAGYYATCGLGPSGETYCWGAGREGELGAPPPEDCSSIPGEAPCATSPLLVTQSFVTIGVGGAHACGLRADGGVFCWGDGTHGQLGFPPPQTSCSPTSTACARTPAALPLESVAALSVGGSHNCVLDRAGVATCWGHNQAGRLGTGDQARRDEPAAVATNLRFTAISAGGTHTCAIAEDGRAYCWGNNYLGQLGDGTLTARLLPTPVVADLRFVDVTTGTAHSCGRTVDGAAYCWGAAEDGQLGTEASLESCEMYGCSLVPVPVAGGHSFSALGAGTFTCGVATDGSYCWGARALGDTVRIPARVGSSGAGGQPFLQLSVGDDHACGITAGLVAYCWGSDYHGKLGDGPEEGGPAPVIVREAPDSMAGS